MQRVLLGLISRGVLSCGTDPAWFFGGMQRGLQQVQDVTQVTGLLYGTAACNCTDMW